MNPPLKLHTATSGKLIWKPNSCGGLKRVSGTCLCVYSTDLDCILKIDMDANHVTSPSKQFSFGWVFSSTWSNTTGSLAFKWSLGWHMRFLFGSVCTQPWLDGPTGVKKGQWDLSINQPSPINSCCLKANHLLNLADMQILLELGRVSPTLLMMEDKTKSEICWSEIQNYHPKRQWQLCAELAIGALQNDGWGWWSW